MGDMQEVRKAVRQGVIQGIFWGAIITTGAVSVLGGIAWMIYSHM